MFDFDDDLCYDKNSPACTRNSMDICSQAGQIISDNLILTKRISVYIAVENLGETPYYAATYSTQQPYNNPENGVVIYYPTALIKQLDPDFDYDGPDMTIQINSYYDQNILYFRDDPIEGFQVDYLELILHELQHGLGVFSFWYSELINDSDLFPDYDYEAEANDAITFYNFKQDIFDTFLVSLDNNNAQTTTYVEDLNNMAGPSSTYYNTYDDFYNELRNKQQEQGKTYTHDMLTMTTTSHKLGFLPKNGGAAIVLDTSFNPLIDGKSIIHFDDELYKTSPEFLLIPEMEPGKKLEDKIQDYENARQNYIKLAELHKNQ
ncbi:hypothetical protein GLOIN_2v1773708 [Rhizophagus clarus]|nr:hypothetical protein GLOIN_2v1773708 [Rhizophagus clarus]